MQSGHHPVHERLQSHSVGGIYPLAVVGYANGDQTLYVIEHLTEGKVLCDPTGVPYQSVVYNVLASIARDGFNSDLDQWVTGRPTYHASGKLMM